MTDMPPNATMLKFGHPASVVAETAAWSVQVRPQQPALGSLVLVCREPVTAFGQLSPDAFADLQKVVARVEQVLGRFVGYHKINYLMLMMVDPDVHFHVIPRYDGTRDYRGLSFADAGWPGPPALGQAMALDAAVLAALVTDLRALWVDAT
ncbi:HIT family protein [Niveispirillum fermenti]|uniref:HIT family protein n=1 Tax=Niveispirillum fermenti TaxID=1233113 RepID=UPI003A86DBD0